MGAVRPSKLPEGSESAVLKKGGKVKKYNEGDIVEEARKTIRSGKNTDSSMDRTPKQREMTFPGEKPVQYNAVEMPSRMGAVKKTINVPGMGEIEKDQIQARKKGGKVGLYENIHKKQARIKAGSGEKMRSVGAKGAPTKADFIKSAKTAKK